MSLNLEDIGQNIERYINDDKFLSSLKANQICKILDNSRLTSSQYSTLFFNLSKYFGKVDMLIILSHAHTDTFQTRNDARLVSDTISSVLGINTLNNLFSFYETSQKTEPEEKKIAVIVQTSAVDKKVFQISPDKTILDLKNLIYQELSIRPEDEELCDDQYFDENEKLKTLSIRDGSSLYLVFNIRRYENWIKYDSMLHYE